MRKMGKSEYVDQFKSDLTKRAVAWDKAWEIRNFEIEMYWKRATYFWAFQVAVFAGYAAFHDPEPSKETWIAYLLSNIGVIVSFAWFCVNRGSKFWQQNWEAHIDILEDDISGPLYKTLNYRNSKPVYSVTQINEKISIFFILAWIGIALKYLVDHSLINLKSFEIDPFVAVSSIVSLAFILWIWRGCKMGIVEPEYQSKLREPKQS